jgi:hypothetical protein
MTFPWIYYFFGDNAIYFYIIFFIVFAIVISVLYKMKADEEASHRVKE